MKYKLTQKEFELLKKRHEKMYKKSKKLALVRMENLMDGDDRENEGYILSEKLLYQSEEERLKLKEILDERNFIEIKNNGMIQQGTEVIIELEGEKVKYFLVSPLLADPEEGRISVESPLGKSIMGKKAGETFSYEAGGVKREGKILEIMMA